MLDNTDIHQTRRGSARGSELHTRCLAALAESLGIPDTPQQENMPFMRFGFLVIAALVLVGCQQWATPVAPSPTAPSVAAPATPPPSGPPFSIRFSTAPSVGFTDSYWQSSVLVLMSTTALNPTRPARVTVNCNNGTPLQEYEGFSGSRPISCAFPDPGTYSVVVSAVGADGFSSTDLASVSVSIRERPTIPVSLLLSGARITGGPGWEEWRFSVIATNGERLTGINWNFGDGSGSTADRNTEQHVYEANGRYTVTVTGVTASRGELRGTKDVEVVLH